MGIYTALDGDSIDDKIERDLQHIVDRLKTMPFVQEIILGGGFGRGEGSVLINEQGVRPVNDYDIFIVVQDNSQFDFKPLAKELASELSMRLIDLIPIKYSNLKSLPPNQFNYDLKYGGRHLWGEDLRDLIPAYEEGIIDEGAGRTLLLNRLICAIEAFSDKFVKGTMNTEETFFLVNQTCKVVSACVEALLIKKGKYHYSYRTRHEIIGTVFPEKTRLLFLNKRATEFKLRPTVTPDFDALQFWKETIHEYIEVLAFYFAPTSAAPYRGLWRRLQKNGSFPCSPVERVEMMLLLNKKASLFMKKRILSQARKELEGLTKISVPNNRWETLREITAGLWHELHH